MTPGRSLLWPIWAIPSRDDIRHSGRDAAGRRASGRKGPLMNARRWLLLLTALLLVMPLGPGTALAEGEEVCNGIDDDGDDLVDDDDPSVTNQTAWYPDADADTFGDADDPGTMACDAPVGMVANNADSDDTNAAVNPGAVEVCNGIDDDSDDMVDDADPSVTGQLMWYADADSDGYGDASDPGTLACVAFNAVTDNSDSDDTNANVNPGATEVCDASDIDEDSDGAADDADEFAVGRSVWYADMDGDGLGDPSNSVLACDQPTGYVSNDNDPNDTSAGLVASTTTVIATKTTYKIKAAGTLRPKHAGGQMLVKLQRRRDGKWRLVQSKGRTSAP